MAIHPGYMGKVVLGGSTSFRFESASLTAKQAWETPDMVMGNWDRAAYHAGKIDVSGSVSGPATATFATGAASGVFGWAAGRGGCGQLAAKDLELIYYCDSNGQGAGTSGQSSRSFTSVYANQVSFSCSAGDNAQFTMDLMSAVAPTWGNDSPLPVNETIEKIITWDACVVEITSGGIVVPTDALLSSFEFSINNNCTPYYSLPSSQSYDGVNNLGYFPTAIIPGLRTVTGTLTAYDPEPFDAVLGYNAPAWDADSGRSQISFKIGDAAPFILYVQFSRVEPTLSVGPIMSTIAFTGVGIQTGLNSYNF